MNRQLPAQDPGECVEPGRGLAHGAERAQVRDPGRLGVVALRLRADHRCVDAAGTTFEDLPVPVDELQQEFAAGGTPDSVCARSIRELTAVGVRHFYVSNLPVNRAAATLDRVLALV